MINTIFQLIGSLGLFLYGMKIMSEGIQKSAGDKLQKIMNIMTKNRFASIGTGVFITSIIQSSSATTVLVVSFVNAGLLTLFQAIGVTMGADIGTTVTGWIVVFFGFSFKISIFALPAIGIGFILMFYKKLNQQNIGEALVGFGLLFLGLHYLKEIVPPINDNPEILEFLKQYTGSGYFTIILFILAGTLLTGIIHSSSAAIAIFITMAFNGWIGFLEAAALVVGSNIGTTIDALLASIGTNVNAKRAAVFHLLFKLAGALWVAILLRPMVSLVDIIIPGDVYPQANDSSRFILTIHIAAFHSLFNIFNTLLFLPFMPRVVEFLKALFKSRKAERPEIYRLKYFSTSIQGTPEINILKAKKEISSMAGLVEEMYLKFLNIFNQPDVKLRNEVNELKDMENITDQMQEQITHFLVQCAEENLNETSAINVSAMLRIVNELESVGDSCFNLMVLASRRYKQKIKFAESAIREIKPFMQRVQDFIHFAKEHLNEHLHKAELDIAFNLEQQIDDCRASLKEHAQDRLQAGADVKAELLYIDMLEQFERIGDFSLNIAQALRKIH